MISSAVNLNEFYTTDQATKVLGVTSRTLERYEKEGLLSPRRINRRRFYSIGEINAITPKRKKRVQSEPVSNEGSSFDAFIRALSPIAENAFSSNAAIVREIANRAYALLAGKEVQAITSEVKTRMVNAGIEPHVVERVVNEVAPYAVQYASMTGGTPVNEDEIIERFVPGNTQAQQALKDLLSSME